MKSLIRKLNPVVILTLVYFKSNQCGTVDVKNLSKLWSLSSVRQPSRTLLVNADKRNVQRFTVVPNQVGYINVINSNDNANNQTQPKTGTVRKQESLEQRNTSRHKNYRRNRLLSSEDWTPRSIPLNYNQEFQPQIENSLKVFDNENEKSRNIIVAKEKNRITNTHTTESIKNVYVDKKPELTNTAIPVIINSNSYIPTPIPFLKNKDSHIVASERSIQNIIPVKRVEPNLPMRRSFLDFDEDSDYDDETEYSKVKRKHTDGEEEEDEEDSNAEEFDPEGEEKKKVPKIKKKYMKYMLPLLLAYKLKFFTLVPLLMGGLVLLTGATGMAGFFFALFAAVMGLKGGH